MKISITKFSLNNSNNNIKIVINLILYIKLLLPQYIKIFLKKVLLNDLFLAKKY